MKGLILNNAYYSIPAYLNQSARLKEEFNKHGISVDILKNDFFGAFIDGGEITSSLYDYDFIVYLDKDKYISEMLEKAGLRLFNRHEAVRVCDDKMRTFIALSNNGIAMPKTLAGLLCFDENEHMRMSSIEKAENELGYPIIVKTCYGSLGKGVYKADNLPQLLKIAESLKMSPHLFQQYIGDCAGTDIRVIVIGGKAVAAMKRVSSSDFRSNIELGGYGEKIDLSDKIKKITEKTAALLGLDYCGIDLLPSNGGYLVCEVNSNAFFGGIEAVTEVNIAKLYCEHIIKEINK